MKKLLTFILTLSFFSALFSQKARLGEQEVRGAKKIRFVNQTSRRAAEEVKEQHSGVGRTLAQGISGKESFASNAISIKRFAAAENKMGGDILILSDSAKFGHINSIKRIISSYISASFEYEETDSDMLALYILYYNAMHRSDIAYVNSKYTDELVVALDADKMGIDENWKNWSGKTQIIIPIVGNILKEEGKDVETTELEKEVSKVIESKKNGKQDQEKFSQLQNKKKETEKKQIVKKEQEVRKKEQEVRKKEEKVNQEIAELKKDPEKNKEAISKKEEEKNQIQEEKKQVAGEKKQVEQKKEQLATGQGGGSATATETAEKKAPETKEELKKELSETKQELAKKEAEEKKKELYDENVVGGKILFLKTLKYLDKGHYNNELQMIDPVKDDMIFKGEYNNICSNSFEVFGEQVLVIGYPDNHTAKHSLVLIDQKSLKKTVESDVSVFWRTPMIIKGEEIYAFEEEGENYYLVRFDKNLKKTARSATDINPDSNVTFYGSKIYLTGKVKETGKIDIVVLKKEDLSFIKRIQP